jgi:CHAT domain-containing protein
MTEGEIRSVDLGEAGTIDHAIGDFGEALANPGAFNEPAVKRAGRALDELVMRPIRDMLGKTTRLLIAPDSELNLLPFAALVDEQGRYLVERYSITYLTSGRDLLRMQDRADSRSAPIVMANPAFDLGDTTAVALASATDGVRGRRSGELLQRWDPLAGTAQEAAAMKKLMSRVQVLEGRAATESALKRVAGPEMLHIATHGFFLPDEAPALPSAGTGAPGNPASENPLLRSGLVLAGANARNGGDGEDGILTALEAAGLDLWGTRLVVLSACETGLGQARSGDGVYGLRRSLVLAGAESQLISLWQVDDKATRDLMVAYYQRLLAGGGRSESLRQVQLDMLRQPELRHPSYWASFIPVGDWRNLKGQDR